METQGDVGPHRDDHLSVITTSRTATRPEHYIAAGLLGYVWCFAIAILWNTLTVEGGRSWQIASVSVVREHVFAMLLGIAIAVIAPAPLLMMRFVQVSAAAFVGLAIPLAVVATLSDSSDIGGVLFAAAWVTAGAGISAATLIASRRGHV
jgi:hypothetical protein